MRRIRRSWLEAPRRFAAFGLIAGVVLMCAILDGCQSRIAHPQEHADGPSIAQRQQGLRSYADRSLNPSALSSPPAASPHSDALTASPGIPIDGADPDDSLVERQHFYSGPVSSHRAKSSGKVAYLTFDDGPSQSTPKILHILKSFGVKATFFVVGNETMEGRTLYKQIADEGHALGNHTYSHDYRTIYRSVEAFRSDVRKLDKLLEETAGYRSDMIRFPGGTNNHLSWKTGGRGIMNSIAKAMLADGYAYFDWNVSSTDAAAPVQDKELIVESVLAASRGKSNIIVLMHDNSHKTTTVEALPIVIRRLQAEGFRFEKLSKGSFTFRFLEP